MGLIKDLRTRFITGTSVEPVPRDQRTDLGGSVGPERSTIQHVIRHEQYSPPMEAELDDAHVRPDRNSLIMAPGQGYLAPPARRPEHETMVRRQSYGEQCYRAPSNSPPKYGDVKSSGVFYRRGKS